MSDPNNEKANTSSTGDETHSLDGTEIGDVDSAVTSLSTPIKSEEVARQIRTATDPLTRQLEKLCDLMLELHKNASRRNEETFAPVQGPSRPRSERFDNGSPWSLLFFRLLLLWGCFSVFLFLLVLTSSSQFLCWSKIFILMETIIEIFGRMARFRAD